MNSRAAFFIGLGIAVGTGAALVVNALPPGSPGDLVYETAPNAKKIPCAALTSFGQAAVNNGLWSGRPQDITEVIIRHDEIRNACIASVRGNVSVDPSDIPVGVTVRGRLP